MTWMLISTIYLFICIGQSDLHDTRSFSMSIMNGVKLQCDNSTCSPSSVVSISSIHQCRIQCLAEAQCQMITFHQSISSCKLFGGALAQNFSMVADADAVTMFVISGTRMPQGQYARMSTEDIFSHLFFTPPHYLLFDSLKFDIDHINAIHSYHNNNENSSNHHYGRRDNSTS